MFSCKYLHDMLFYILYVLNISILFLTLILMWLSFFLLFFFFNVLLLVHKTPRVACSLFVVTCFSENEMDVVVVRTGSVSFKGFLKNIYHVGRDGFQSLSSHLSSVYAAFTVSLQKKKKTNFSHISGVTVSLYHVLWLRYFFLEINQTYLKLPVPFCAHIFFYLVMK